MRLFATSLAVAALLMLSPLGALGKGSSGSKGGSQGNNGPMGGMNQGGSGGAQNFSKNWNGNRDWSDRYYRRGYWYNGYWYGDGDYYTVQRPILDNFSGDPIRITNPLSNRTALSYTLNGVVYTIQPGSSQDFLEDRAWVIDFSRGANFGEARYGLHAGAYAFGKSGNGWELFQVPVTPPASAVPANPPALSPSVPTNPAP